MSWQIFILLTCFKPKQVNNINVYVINVYDYDYLSTIQYSIFGQWDYC